MNNLSIAGTVGRDAETKSVSGKDVTSWSVAVKDGPERTLWVDCSMWGERGTKVAAYIRKGGRVAVTGQASVRSYLKDGEPRAVLGLRVNDLTLLGDGGKSSDEQPRARRGSTAPGAGAFADDLDIPFAPRHWLEGA